MATIQTSADLARINRREAMIYAREIAYLGCPHKIEMHVWRAYGVKLSPQTLEGILAERRPKRSERRTFKPEIGLEDYNEEADGNAMWDNAWEASEQLAQAIASYRGMAA